MGLYRWPKETGVLTIPTSYKRTVSSKVVGTITDSDGNSFTTESLSLSSSNTSILTTSGINIIPQADGANLSVTYNDDPSIKGIFPITVWDAWKCVVISDNPYKIVVEVSYTDGTYPRTSGYGYPRTSNNTDLYITISGGRTLARKLLRDAQSITGNTNAVNTTGPFLVTVERSILSSNMSIVFGSNSMGEGFGWPAG
jgi:hypothetical protein